MDKKKQLIEKLRGYFKNDETRLKALITGCKSIDFPLGKNIEAIEKEPEAFMLLITYSDLGILGKLEEALYKLKGNQ